MTDREKLEQIADILDEAEVPFSDEYPQSMVIHHPDVAEMEAIIRAHLAALVPAEPSQRHK